MSTVTTPNPADRAAHHGRRRPRLRRPTGPGGWLLWLVGGLVAAIVAGNVAIISTHLVAWAVGPDDDLEIPGIPRARAVDDELWRGRAPTLEGYRELAARGVTTIVDLRAEGFIEVPSDLLAELGIERIHVPIRDGQTPDPAQVATLLDAVEQSDAPVFMHCGAGVGRTGAMAAAYSAITSDRSNLGLLWENFSIGPPSFEQIVYAATVEGVTPQAQPNAFVKTLSRFLDGPRRIWHNLNGDV